MRARTDGAPRCRSTATATSPRARCGASSTMSPDDRPTRSTVTAEGRPWPSPAPRVLAAGSGHRGHVQRSGARNAAGCSARSFPTGEQPRAARTIPPTRDEPDRRSSQQGRPSPVEHARRHANRSTNVEGPLPPQTPPQLRQAHPATGLRGCGWSGAPPLGSTGEAGARMTVGRAGLEPATEGL